MDVEMRIRRSLLSLLDEEIRVAVYPTDALSMQPGTGREKKTRGIVYLAERTGNTFHVKCATIKKGAELDEIKGLAMVALKLQGLKNLKVEGDTITVSATIGKGNAS